MIAEQGAGLRLALSRVALVVVAALWLGPYAWMTLTSLKTLPEIVRAPAYPLPSSLQFGAYREVFATVPVGRYFLNTIVMAVAIALLQITLALPAGYALAKLRFAGRWCSRSGSARSAPSSCGKRSSRSRTR
jgi:sn-glycerol 3-phosphate transport system permease protein